MQTTNANPCDEDDVGPMLDENAVGPMLDDSEIPPRPKRKRKMRPDYESYMKERANVKKTPKPSKATPSADATNVSKELIDKSSTDVKQTDCKLAEANQQRKSARRPTISGSRPKISDSDKRTDVVANTLAISGNLFSHNSIQIKENGMVEK